MVFKGVIKVVGLLVFVLIGACLSLPGGTSHDAFGFSLFTSKPNAYKDGLAYMEARAYDKAVVKLTEALRKKPKNKRIQKALKQAKKLGAKEHYEKGVKFSNKNKINAALFELEKAKTYLPDNTIYLDRYNREKRKYIDLTATMKSAIKNAAQHQQWDEAIKTLESFKIYESSFSDISQKIGDLKKNAAVYHEKLSDQNLSQKEYNSALKEIEKAIHFSEEEKLKNKKKAIHHLLLSNIALKNKDYLNAYEEISKGLEFQPNQPELKNKEHLIINQWVDILYNEAIQASNDGNLALAEARLSRLSRLKPGYLNVEKLLAEYQSSLASTYYTKAVDMLNLENHSMAGTALAYLLLVREQHKNQFPDLDDKILAAKKLLRKEVELRISIDFKNESQEPGAASYVKDQLLARLKGSRGLKNIVILEREAINEILREQGLGQGFLDESTSLQVKKIKGIQAGIKGSIVKVRIKESGMQRPTYGSSKYKSGTRMVPNPLYPQAQMTANQSQQEYMIAQQDANAAKLESSRAQAQYGAAGLAGAFQSLGASLTAAGARNSASAAKQKWEKAQQKLAETPMQIKEDIWSDFRYEMYDLKLEGEVVITFRMINFTTSEIGKVHTIKKSDVATDKYVPGDPGKGVPTDPNTLPTEEEFKKILLAEAINETVLAMKEELSTYSFEFYTKGLRAEEDNLPDTAMEKYMRFIYSAPDLHDPRVQHANSYIYKKTGLMLIRKKSG